MKAKPATKMVAIVFAFLSAGALCARAQTDVTWNGGSGNWNTAGDWSGGVVPNNGSGKTYAVTISNGEAETVTLNLSATVSDLTLGSEATLQSAAGDSLTIASGGTLTNSGTILFNTTGSNITIASGGTLTNNGTLDLEASGETLSVTGTTTNGANGTIEIEGGSAATFTGSVNNSGMFITGFSGGDNTVTVTGTFTNAAGATLALEGSGDVMSVNALSNLGTLTLDSGTTLTITGGGSGVTDVAAGTTYNIGGTFNVKNGSTTTNALASLTSVEGTLDLQNGKTTSITPTGGTLTISNTGSINLSQASATTTTLSITGNVNNSGAVTTGFSGGTNTVNVSGTFTNAAGATLELESSTDAVNVNALSNSGTIEIGDSANSGATLTITGGGSGVTDIAAGSAIELYGNFNVVNSGKTTSALANLNSVEGTLTIENGQTTSVTPTSGTLTIAAGGAVELSHGGVSNSTLSITGNVNNSGIFSTGFSGGSNTVDVSGTFTNAAGGNTILYSTTDKVNVNALSNSGYLQIGNSAGSGATLTITGGGQGVTDVVAGSTIELFGNLNVVNSGKTTSALANLNTVAGDLDLMNDQTTSVTPSSGTLTIASGGYLQLSGTTASTSGLSITSNVSNSGNFTTGYAGGTNTAAISGTFTNNSGGLLELYAGLGVGTGTDSVSIGTLTNAGTVALAGSGATLDITGTGTLTNSGSIDLTLGTLKFSASSATLTGGGTVTLGNSTGTQTGTIQVGASDTGTLTNSNNTITGYGNIGNGTLTLVNGGTINANGQITSGTLTVQPGSGGMTNTGTIEASNEGILILEGTVNNAGGKIEALGETNGITSATVELANGTVINGGTLTTTTVGSNSGVIEGLGSVTLSGVTNSGTYAVNAGTTTTLEGTIANSGTITLTGSTLSIGNNVTLSGKGTVVLSNSTANLISGATTGLTLTNANTIEGAGTISNLGIANTGTIEASQSSPLLILPSSAGLNNEGTLTVAAGDTMEIGNSAGGALLNYSGTTLTGGTYNVSGTLEFGASGTSVVTDAANISLTGSAAKIVDFAGQNVLAGLATITSAGSLTLSSGADFTTAGNFTNSGALTVNTGSEFVIKGSLTNFNSSTDTLTGGVYIIGGKIGWAGANIVTDASEITLDGTGEIVNTSNGANGLANLATIATGGILTLDKASFTTAGNFTNNGTLIIYPASTLKITGTLTDFNSSTDTLTKGIYEVGGTLEFTGANIVTNAANLTFAGPSGQILNGTANGLANFANNTGSLLLTESGKLTTGAAAFTNTGKVTVDAGSTLTVGGGNSYTQSAGTTQIDGTLTASGGINVTGGTMLGAGKLSGSVSVGGSGTTPTLNVGDTGKAGLLAITGNYTQLSTATMNSFVGGTTVGTQYSQLQVSGTASLAGNLTVTLASGFTPTVGSSFTVLTASSISGTFSDSEIAINSSEHFNVSYTSTGVVLTVASGAAGAPSDSPVGSVPKRQPILVSGLRRRVGTAGRGGFFVASKPTSGRTFAPRSGAILAGGYGSPGYAVPNRGPAQSVWNYGFSVPRGIQPVERIGRAVSSVPVWGAPAHSVLGARMPVTSTPIHREPVKILTSPLPRFAR
jgi:fibronectin-binding autotransporter adhesin